MFISIHVSVYLSITPLKSTSVHIFLYFLVCWLTWVVTEQYTYEWRFVHEGFHERCWSMRAPKRHTHIIKLIKHKSHLSTPFVATPGYTPTLILHSLAMIFTSLKTFGYHSYIIFPCATSTCKPAEQQNKPEATAGFPPTGDAWHRKFGLSQWSPQRRSRYSKNDFINVSSKKQ